MNVRIRDNRLKGLLFVVLFIVLILKTMVSEAQFGLKNPYKGFTVNFGTRSAGVTSNISAINGADLVQSGGQIGLVFGNRLVRSKIGVLGYYSSSKNTPGTVDLYNSNMHVNFYPLSLFSKTGNVIEPYLTAGLDYDQFKFYGHYSNLESGNSNYSMAEAPYIGKLSQTNATVGVGVEVELLDHFDFIHLFTEIRYAGTLSSKSKNASLDNTFINNQMQFIIGFTFGARR